MQRFVHNLVLALLLLTQLAESMPSFHGHETTHACTEVNGQFVYIAHIDGTCPTDGQAPFLRAFEMGRRHNHQECPLCHQTAMALFDLPGSKLAHIATAAQLCLANTRVADATPSVLRSRGPPLLIA